MPYLVNSAPGPGLRSEPSVTVAEAPDALSWATGLEKRGMRAVRIKDVDTGQVYDIKGLQAFIRNA